MSFHRSLCVLAVLANSAVGASAGNITKRVGGYGCKLSKGQVERTLKALVDEGYVMARREKYRPGIDIIYYHLTELAAQAFIELTRDYSEKLKQLEIEMVAQVS